MLMSLVLAKLPYMVQLWCWVFTLYSISSNTQHPGRASVYSFGTKLGQRCATPFERAVPYEHEGPMYLRRIRPSLGKKTTVYVIPYRVKIGTPILMLYKSIAFRLGLCPISEVQRSDYPTKPLYTPEYLPSSIWRKRLSWITRFRGQRILDFYFYGDSKFTELSQVSLVVSSEHDVERIDRRAYYSSAWGDMKSYDA